MNFVGIEIGGTKVQLALGMNDGRIIAHQRFRVDPSQGAKGIQNQILEGLKQFKKQYSFKKIGVGFGGPVDRTAGKIIRSHHIANWEGFEIVHWLESEMNVPVVLENDANVAALAEAILGAGRGLSPIFYMTMGSGIGGGVVLEGKIYHGAFPSEAEIGHMRIPVTCDPKDWPTLESLCSGWSLNARLRRHSKGEMDGLLQAIDQGDVFCTNLLKETAQHLAFALSNVVHLFHPQAIILGGGVSHLGEPLVKGIEVVLNDLVMEVLRGTYRIKIAALGENVVPIGGILLASD